MKTIMEKKGKCKKESWYFHVNASRQQLGKGLPKAGYLLAQQKTADIYS